VNAERFGLHAGPEQHRSPYVPRDSWVLVHRMTSRNSATAPTTHGTDLGPELRVDVRPELHGVRVCPVGEIDLASVGCVRRTVDRSVGAGCERVVLDLRGVTFLDSAGVHLALDADAAARRAGWELLLMEGPAPVQRTFELTGARDRLPFIDVPPRSQAGGRSLQ
jgi:anti-sigma B factor antagonist